MEICGISFFMFGKFRKWNLLEGTDAPSERVFECLSIPNGLTAAGEDYLDAVSNALELLVVIQDKKGPDPFGWL